MAGSRTAGLAPADVALDALRLRRWALAVLRDPGSPAAAEVPPARAVAWRAFLQVERCAIDLHGRLAAGSLSGRLGDDARALLDAFRLHELKRALSARAQLAQLAETARREGCRVVVLKGGVPIAEGAYLDVVDVDVLLHPTEAVDFARSLEREAEYRASREDAPVDGEGVYHLASRRAPNTLLVEVHFAVNGLGDGARLVLSSVPLDAVPGLWRLGPEDHVFHLLFHAGDHHPNRSGCLRDLLMIARARREWGGSFAALEPRFSSAGEAESARAMLALAESLDGGAPAPDPFVTVAAANYLFWGRDALWKRPVSGYPFSSASHLARGSGSYGRWARRLLTTVDAPTTGDFRFVAGWAPPVRRVLHGAGRMARLAWAAPTALGLSREAERVVERLEREGG